MARVGRKRKAGIRERSGVPQRQLLSKQQEENKLVAIEARMRHFNIDKNSASDPRWGHTIGVLELRLVISRKQAEAANKYLVDYIRLHKLKGYPRMNPKIAAYAQMIPGYDSYEEPDETEIAKATKRMNDVRSFIVGRLGPVETAQCLPAFERYIINQANGDMCSPREAGSIRTILNQLMRFYKV